jgi:hypothetical protein
MELFGGYESIWFFRDKNDNPLDPTMYVVQFIIHLVFNPKRLSNEQRRDFLKQAIEDKNQLLADNIDLPEFYEGTRVGYTKGMQNVIITP